MIQFAVLWGVAHLTPLSPRGIFLHFKHEVFIKWGDEIGHCKRCQSCRLWSAQCQYGEAEKMRKDRELVKTNYWVIRFTFTKLQSAHLHSCACVSRRQPNMRTHLSWCYLKINGTLNEVHFNKNHNTKLKTTMLYNTIKMYKDLKANCALH